MQAGATALAATALSGRAASALVGTGSASALPFTVNFASVPKGYTENLVVAAGYQAKPLIRWGDAVLPQAPSFNPADWNAEAQSKTFGYNNDFLAFLPLDGRSDHGLLHVNHEYTNAHLMFANTTKKSSSETISEEQLRIEQQAHGFSTVEIKRDAAGEWQVIAGSRYAKRRTATTPMSLSGPAAGHKRLQTAADASGRKVLGTVGNCAGGVTPWGTVLVAEENIDGYFTGTPQGPEKANHTRYTVAKKSYYGWHRMDDRFDIDKTPHEPNRFGWVVEYDPYDPEFEPVKRTALGRFKHESATCSLTHDGRVVVYSGDDDYFEYIYRFVSRDQVNLVDRAANKNLLDHGTLSVAKFHDDGVLEWIPLIHGERGLTAENGFKTQADIVIEARRAGDRVGATKMDRPEGIAISPQDHSVYVALTRNPYREKMDKANPREENRAGHIVRMEPPAMDHTAMKFAWHIHYLAGDPENDSPHYHGRAGKNDWFGNPDNLAFHPSGSLWIATDGMPKTYGYGDGLYATNGMTPPKCFLRAPKGAEVTGPCFTPDGKSLFISIQHPGEDKGSTFDSPSTRWPDFDENLPPRPSVIAITQK